MSNSTAAATSGPARQPRPASSAPATQRTPSPRSCWKSLRPVRLERFGARRGAGATSGGVTEGGSATAATSSAASSRTLEETDPLRRPVGGEGAADDPLTGNGTPEPAVVGLPTVVAHHEPVVGRNRDLGREVAPRAALAGPREVVLLLLAVHVRMAVADVDPVARAGDDALDEVHVGLLVGRQVARGARLAVAVAARVGVRPRRRVEHDDLADVRVVEAVAQPVDEHALADLERRDHRLARDPVRLDQEGLDAEGEADRDDDDDDELDERAARRPLLLGPAGAEQAHCLSSSAVPASGSAGASATGSAAASASAGASACAATASSAA